MNSIDGLKYVRIPPGEFRMGCSGSGCSPGETPHRVRITREFWIGQTEVTQAAYERVMKVPNPSGFKGADLPVDGVSWNDADKYCKAVGMRLPIEAEWEYAARAGSTEELYGEIGKIATYGSFRTAKSGSKWPNAWGLYDMLGNVWEWTNDWYDADYYKTSPPDGPPGPPETRLPGPPEIRLKVLRGGSWADIPVSIRVSYRNGRVPWNRNSVGVGFRCAGELH